MAEQHETFGIKGMHCKSCVHLVESKVGSIKGVNSIKVDLSHDKAQVSYKPEETSLERIKQEVEALGYRAGGPPARKSKGILQGIAYGLVPHIGCIGFIIGSIIGVTMLTEFARPLLMNRYFFYILVGISLLFATTGAILYLRSNGLLSLAGMRKKWLYLSTMYGTTVGVNILLFLLVFPLLANVSTSQAATGNAVAANVAGDPTSPSAISSLQLQVDIPCSGHAPLISSELKTLAGVTQVQFSVPNKFDVGYDSAKTSKEQILALEVFKEYPATVISESESATGGTATSHAERTSLELNPGASCGCGSCGESSGGSCGSAAS
jgi:copper ion binding protein